MGKNLESKRVFVLYFYLKKEKQFIWLHQVLDAAHRILSCSTQDTPAGKESACNAGDPTSIPGLGRSPGEGNGNPLQYSVFLARESYGWRSLVGHSPWGARVLATKPRPPQFEVLFFLIQNGSIIALQRSCCTMK